MICMYVDLKGVAHWPLWMDPHSFDFPVESFISD